MNSTYSYLSVLFLTVPILGFSTPKKAGYFKKLDSHHYLIVLESGARVLEALKTFQKNERVLSGSLTGVGVFKNTTLGFYKFNSDGSPGKTHEENTVKEAREVVSLTCLFTTAVAPDRKPEVFAPPHCHISLAGSEKPEPAQGFPVVGGHLIEAEVGVTAELIVTTFPTKVIKRPSEDFGGILVDINEQQKGTPIFVSGQK